MDNQGGQTTPTQSFKELQKLQLFTDQSKNKKINIEELDGSYKLHSKANAHWLSFDEMVLGWSGVEWRGGL